MLGAAAAAGGLAFKLGAPTPSEAHGTESDNEDPAIIGHNIDDGPGVLGESEGGAGLYGVSSQLHGVQGRSAGVAGVIGYSVAGEDDLFTPEEAIDYGSGFGVVGVSGSGRGVVGVSESGVGVLGRAPGSAPGVAAISGGPVIDPAPDGGLALQVLGKSQFSTVGSGLIRARANRSTVVDEAVSAGSHVMATMTSDSGGAAIAWVEVSNGRFVLHLTDRVRRSAKFSYFVIN